MNEFSIVIPVDGKDRLKLLENTLNAYINFGIPKNTVFIFVTRNKLLVGEFLKPFQSSIDYILIEYKYEGTWFNPALALNLGVKYSLFNNIIITCPEVMPTINVLKELQTIKRNNIVFNVLDDYGNGQTNSLVNTKYRGETPAMYFLAVFKKEDLYTINGWDLDFMKGYAFEDSDFGLRFNRAGLNFKIIDTETAIHQFHKRESSDSIGWEINRNICDTNTRDNIIFCKRGLKDV